MNPEILEKLLDYIDVQRRCAVAQAALNSARDAGGDGFAELTIARDLEQYRTRMRADLRALNHNIQGDGK